jgi:hypothetical protein
VIGELDQAYLRRRGAHVLDLKTLPLLFRETLVIRQGIHEGPDTRPESELNVSARDARILDNVVQNRSRQNLLVLHSGDANQQLGDINQMIDVGFTATLSPLLRVRLRRERECPENNLSFHVTPKGYRRSATGASNAEFVAETGDYSNDQGTSDAGNRDDAGASDRKP